MERPLKTETDSDALNDGSPGDDLGALIDYHRTLATDMRTAAHLDKSLRDCLDLVANAFGYDSHDQLTAAPAEPDLAQGRGDEILRFWQSPALSDFITDYASRRNPVVLALGGDGSIIAAETHPNTVFEIRATVNGFTVFDLGLGPFSPNDYDRVRIPLGTHATIAQAFAALAQSQNWEWA